SNTKEAGLYSGQTPEVYGILKFIFDNPEIAMVFTLGSSDFCLNPPESDRKGDPQTDKIKIPSHIARMLGVDPSQTYTMDEVIALLKEQAPGETELTPAVVAGMLGLGAAVNPMEDDLEFYKHYAEACKTYLRSQNFNYDNLESIPAKDGSFELWAYYHLGVPSFSMNLFSVPVVKEIANEKGGSDSADNGKKKKTDTKEQCLAKDRALLAWSDKELKGEGFKEWKKFNHPTLGEVWIGGFIPYIETTPKANSIEPLLKIKLPWLLQLAGKLPQISIIDNKVTNLGAGVYKLELYIENKGQLPFPVSMGQRNNQPAPVVIVLEGDFELLEGLSRVPLGNIGGNQVKKLTWMIKADKKTDISVKTESVIFGESSERIIIGG
ncbi:MAG: hypothetical protein PHH93_07175, partial [Prolixibacteraceae bacterium]|nr:hypothetical protein [Prolixibacteraceae bacterium]